MQCEWLYASWCCRRRSSCYHYSYSAYTHSPHICTVVPWDNTQVRKGDGLIRPKRSRPQRPIKSWFSHFLFNWIQPNLAQIFFCGTPHYSCQFQGKKVKVQGHTTMFAYFLSFRHNFCPAYSRFLIATFLSHLLFNVRKFCFSPNQTFLLGPT